MLATFFLFMFLNIQARSKSMKIRNQNITFEGRKISPKIIRKCIIEEKPFDTKEYLKNPKSFRKLITNIRKVLDDLSIKSSNVIKHGDKKGLIVFQNNFTKAYRFWENIEKNQEFINTWEKICRNNKMKDQRLTHKINSITTTIRDRVDLFKLNHDIIIKLTKQRNQRHI